MPPNPGEECTRLIKAINKKQCKVEKLEQKITGYKKEIKELNQKVREKEETCKKKIEDLEKEVTQLRNEIEELKKELREKNSHMDLLENTMKENEKSYREEMEELKTTIEGNEKCHKEEMKKIKDGMCKIEKNNARIIHELKISHDEEIEELEEFRTAYEMNEEANEILTKKNKELKYDSKDRKKLIQDQHKLYLGQVCYELQTNLYLYVMPEGCCAKDEYYKIKDIEKDIENLLEGNEKQKAEKRLQELKKEIKWEELQALIGAIKQLQYQRNIVGHPEVDEKQVKHAAKKLNEQGLLKGKTEYENVMKIIDKWSKSKSLLGGHAES